MFGVICWLAAGAIHTSYCHGKQKTWYNNKFSGDTATMFPGTLAYNPETYPQVNPCNNLPAARACNYPTKELDGLPAAVSRCLLAST